MRKWNGTCHEYVNRLKWHELLLMPHARWIYWNTLTIYGRMFRSLTHWFPSFSFVYILKIEWIQLLCARCCVNDFVKKKRFFFQFCSVVPGTRHTVLTMYWKLICTWYMLWSWCFYIFNQRIPKWEQTERTETSIDSNIIH